MEVANPIKKRLIRTWLILISLTLLSMASAQVNSTALPLPIWGVFFVLVITGFKVQQVLMVYLNLRVSSAGWRWGFLWLLTSTLLIIFSAYLVTHLR